MTAESKEEGKRTEPYRTVCVESTGLTRARLSSSRPAHRGSRPRAGPGDGWAFAQGSKRFTVCGLRPRSKAETTRPRGRCFWRLCCAHSL